MLFCFLTLNYLNRQILSFLLIHKINSIPIKLLSKIKWSLIKVLLYFENFEKNLAGNENKEAIIATELKRTNELDITKYDNNELAQFIGVGRNVTPIDDFLNKFLKIDKREEKNVNDFVNNVLQDEGRIDLALEKWFYS